MQQGLLEEEVNRNLSAAVQAYEAAVKQADAQRQAAATAVFRLAESYRKLGRTNEAVAQYRRVLDQFGDQAVLVGLSQTSLARLAPEPVVTGSPRLTPAALRQKELLEQELALVQEQHPAVALAIEDIPVAQAVGGEHLGAVIVVRHGGANSHVAAAKSRLQHAAHVVLHEQQNIIVLLQRGFPA